MSESQTLATSVEKLRAQISGYTNDPQSNDGIAKQAVQQIAREVMDRRVKVLVAAIRQLEKYEASLAAINKPDSLFYQLVGAEFQAFPLYSDKLVKQIERDQKTIKDLYTAADKACKQDATAADHEELENLLRPLNIL